MGHGIQTQRTFLPILLLAGVRRRAHVDIESALRIERESLVRVLPLFRKFADHGLARPGGRELALLERIAVHADVVGHIQPVLEDAHFRALHVAERRDHVGLAIADWCRASRRGRCGWRGRCRRWRPRRGGGPCPGLRAPRPRRIRPAASGRRCRRRMPHRRHDAAQCSDTNYSGEPRIAHVSIPCDLVDSTQVDVKHRDLRPDAIVRAILRQRNGGPASAGASSASTRSGRATATSRRNMRRKLHDVLQTPGIRRETSRRVRG